MTAITSAQIATKFSVASAAGNTTAGAASTSLGDQISTTLWVGGAINDLFDNISGAENAASTVDYRCLFVTHSNPSNTFENPVVFVSSEVAGGASVTIAIDNLAASAIGAATPQAAMIASEVAAPIGVGAFSAPTTLAAGLALSNLLVGYCRAFWVKRAATNSVAINGDGCTLTIAGDTGAL